jgi:7-keto-8-aminopelargonate synthetase-like enzyme
LGLQDKLENPESQSADHLDWVQHELDIISNAGLKRFRKALNFCPDGSIIYRKKKLVNFASSDYLAFSKHPAVIHSARKAIHSYGVGAGASKSSNALFAIGLAGAAKSKSSATTLFTG